MQQHRGFSLLESVVYLTLFALLGVMTSSFVARLLHSTLSKSRTVETTQLLWVISRVLACDLEQGSALPTDWEITDSAITRRMPTYVRWSSEFGSLWRTEGKMHAKVADGMRLCLCTPLVKNARVCGIRCTLRCQRKPEALQSIDCYVPVLKGLVCICSLSSS